MQVFHNAAAHVVTEARQIEHHTPYTRPGRAPLPGRAAF